MATHDDPRDKPAGDKPGHLAVQHAGDAPVRIELRLEQRAAVQDEGRPVEVQPFTDLLDAHLESGPARHTARAIGGQHPDHPRR